MRSRRSDLGPHRLLLVAVACAALGCASVAPPVPPAPTPSAGAPAASPPARGDRGPAASPTPASPAPDPSAVPTVTAPPSTPAPTGSPAPERPLLADDPLISVPLQQVIEQAQRELPIPGISALMVLPDGSTWRGATGLANVATKRPVEPDTAFSIGSITKTFVAALTLQLVDEGVLGLDDRLSRWVPSFPNASRITIRQLLNHTSGIYNYFEHPDYNRLVFEQPTKRWRTAEILELVAKPYFPPGRGYHYSNTNYVLLGSVIEEATGNSVGTELRRRFLEPLGLTSTFFQGEERVGVRAAEGYLYGGGRFAGLSDGAGFVPNTSAATVAWTAGAMVSNTRDLGIWARALYTGGLLSTASRSALTDFGEIGYGLGTRQSTLDKRPAIGHNGSLRGFVAALWHLPVEDITVVVLTNRGRIDAQHIGRGLVRAFIRQLRATRACAPARPSPSLPGSSLPPSTAPGASPAPPASPSPAAPPVSTPAGAAGCPPGTVPVPPGPAPSPAAGASGAPTPVATPSPVASAPTPSPLAPAATPSASTGPSAPPAPSVPALTLPPVP